MGILRSDRVSGLGGANAINGSAFFSAGTGIETAPSSAWDFTTSDFTIEFWTYFIGFDASGFTTFIKTGDTTAANSIWQIDLKTSTNNLRFIPYVSNSSVVYESSWTPSTNTWYHVAATKSGTSIRMFVDGTQIGSTHTFSQTWDSETVGLSIGKRAIGSFERDFNGYLSNMRIIKGTALYTANFTPPTARLEKTSDTVFLAFQSPGDVLKEETGKILYPSTDGEHSAPAVASRFAPDIGEDHGTTFEDNTKFDTLSYVVPPGGTTAESNRGRAVFGSGETPSNDKVMDYVQIQSMGSAIKFGDLSATNIAFAAVSSSTRGVFAVGISPNITMEYITFATTSNSTDFGDQNEGHIQEASCSNNTRGLFAGGLFAPNTIYNSIEYITIATTGNDTDFGDLTRAGTGIGGLSDTTRGVWAGGITGSPYPKVNIIDYVTIATTGNATDFGDLTFSARDPGSLASSTRGLIGGGNTPSLTNVIDYITIQTTGNATDYGDLTVAQDNPASTSNGTRGLWGTGATPTIVNSVEYATIATLGNAADFGDLTRAVYQEDACSDSHGGIS